MSGLMFGHMCKKLSNPLAVILCIPEKSRNFKQEKTPTEAIALWDDITITLLLDLLIPKAFISNQMTAR